MFFFYYYYFFFLGKRGFNRHGLTDMLPQYFNVPTAAANYVDSIINSLYTLYYCNFSFRHVLVLQCGAVVLCIVNKFQ
jgi:hypothetical protein